MSELKEVLVPDIGDFKDVEVIEVAVSVGDSVEEENSLITLETDKAAMEIPSPYSGVVKDLKINVGDKVSKGSLILTLTANGASAQSSPQIPEEKTQTVKPSLSEDEVKLEHKAEPKLEPEQEIKPPANINGSNKNVYAGPAVRRFAGELGVDLTLVTGSGPKGRIVKKDITTFVKGALKQGGGTSGGLNVPAMPEVDFSKFGEVETKPLMRIKKLTATNLHRNWVSIPHVTQFDEADITDLEIFRKANKASVEKQGAKLTPLVFIMKAVVSALQEFPQFNASLSHDSQNVIYKKYFHIGIAVDTPNGLVVPVVRDVDKKSLSALALELGQISVKARDGKLTANDMQGGSISISSLGGISGTQFTPIINAPEVAILGVSKAYQKPVWRENEFIPRLTLPLSLSYDHRIIDGAEAARFTKYLTEKLSDIRTLLL